MTIGVRTGVPDRSQEQAPHSKVRPVVRIDGNADGEGDPLETMKPFMYPTKKAEYVGWGEAVNENAFHKTGAPNAAEFGMIGGQPKGKK